MNTFGYIVLGVFALGLLRKQGPAGSPAPGAINQANTDAAQAAAAGLTPVFQQDRAQVFVDDSGELVTINSTGGTTALPDPHGIGGGFAT